jgi:DNA-binding response OmpR family regulator
MKGKRVKLLIVDDEKDICGFAKLLFRKKGFLAYSALSGVGALRLAKKIKPDIALLDLLRQSLPDCRCVMVTWDKEQAKMKEAKKLGAVSYLTKPLTTAQLLRVIDAVAKGIRKRG